MLYNIPSNGWKHLPNAEHIRCIFQSVAENHAEWVAAYDGELYVGITRGSVWFEVRATAERAGRLVEYNDTYHCIAFDSAWRAAYDAVVALIAYDDIEHYLFSSYEELQLIAALSNHPAAILLLPVVKARELIEEKNEQVVTSS